MRERLRWWPFSAYWIALVRHQPVCWVASRAVCTRLAISRFESGSPPICLLPFCTSPLSAKTKIISSLVAFRFSYLPDDTQPWGACSPRPGPNSVGSAVRLCSLMSRFDPENKKSLKRDSILTNNNFWFWRKQILKDNRKVFVQNYNEN